MPKHSAKGPDRKKLTKWSCLFQHFLSYLRITLRIPKYDWPEQALRDRQSSCLTASLTCICTRNSVFILREASLSEFSPLCPTSESISSMKMMEGAFSRAIWNKLATSFSLSPIHFDTRSEEEMLQGVRTKLSVHSQTLGQERPFGPSRKVRYSSSSLCPRYFSTRPDRIMPSRYKVQASELVAVQFWNFFNSTLLCWENQSPCKVQLSRRRAEPA